MVTRGTVPGEYIIIVMISVLISRGTHGDFSCTADYTNYKTSVTCFFGQNINQTKYDFNARFRPNPGADAHSILMCNWMTEEHTRRTGQDLMCLSRHNFTFNKKVSDQLTITGPPPSDRMDPEYWCSTVPNSDTPVHTCKLTHKAGPTATTTPAPPSSQPQLSATARPPHRSSGYGRQGDHTEDIAHWARVSVATLVLLILCIVIVIVFILYKKRQRIMKLWRSKTNRGSGPTDTEDTAESSSLCDIENTAELLLKRKDNQYLNTLDALAAFLYNKGWKEALQAHGIKTEMTGGVWKTPQNLLLTDPGHSDELCSSTEKEVEESPDDRAVKLSVSREEWKDIINLRRQREREEKEKQKKKKTSSKNQSKETTCDGSGSPRTSISDPVSAVSSSADAPYCIQNVSFRAMPQVSDPGSTSGAQEQETSVSTPEATPQDREASVPLMEGQQGPYSDDGDRTTAVMTVDQAGKRKEEAKAIAKEAKTKLDEAEKNAKMKANKNVVEIQNAAKEAKTRHEEAKKEVEEARKALKLAKSKK